MRVLKVFVTCSGQIIFVSCTRGGALLLFRRARSICFCLGGSELGADISSSANQRQNVRTQGTPGDQIGAISKTFGAKSPSQFYLFIVTLNHQCKILKESVQSLCETANYQDLSRFMNIIFCKEFRNQMFLFTIVPIFAIQQKPSSWSKIFLSLSTK